MKTGIPTLSCLAVLVLALSSGVQVAQAERSTFDDITYDDIIATPMSGDPIPGHDNEENQIPAGTIVVYRTDESRYGKLLIEEYGIDLHIRWHTYTLDGAGVHDSGNDLQVGGTYLCDLDTGVVGTDLLISDFRWELDTSVERYLEPWNGAVFAVYGHDVPTQASTWSGIKRIHR